ncbi:MAG: hypothetical protein GXO88_01200, partial [Chlorobi bacterium]|nr:hypothetical protein [Chlorobiota bacterium]
MLKTNTDDDYWKRLIVDEGNFYQIVDLFEVQLINEYPDSIPKSKMSNINEYERFFNFWNSRLGLYSNTISYQPYQDEITNQISAPYCYSGDPANWELVGPVANSKHLLGLVRRVIHDPSVADSYLLASDYGGLWKKQQNSNSWVNVTDNFHSPGLAISEIVRDPKDNNHLIASTSSGLHTAGAKAGYGLGIIESFDNGNSWYFMWGFSAPDAKGIVKILFDPSDPDDNTLYAITYNTIYKSTDMGQNWNIVPGPAITIYDIFLDIEINSNGTIFLPISEFIGCGISHSSDEIVVAGATHNHSFKYENNSWSNFSSGDGGDCEVNWNDNKYYYSTQSSYHSNSTFSFSNQTGGFIGMEYEQDPSDPNIIYYAWGKTSSTSNAFFGKYDQTTDIKTKIYVPNEIDKVGAFGINTNNEYFVADFRATNELEPNRFVKSTDGGNTWTDLSNSTVYFSQGSTSLATVIVWKTIEDIIFNPDDPNELWISVGGVKTANGSPQAETLRVLHSVNGGTSWNDYSAGLSAFPVMALEYQAGSNNRIFAGTDAGVFYREPGMNQWQCFSNNLPTSIITDLDYNPCNSYLYASTYGRSMYKTYVPFDDNLQLIVDQPTVLWDKPKEIVSDVLIKSGTELTISNNMYISKGKKIMIEPGATLILDNAYLTNGCGESWEGIEVWGDKNEYQYTINGICAQGKLIIKQSTLENAVNAITLWKPNDWNKTGGIVIAEHANFINNRRTAEFISYRNFHPVTGETTDNLSSFTNCSFTYNDDYFIPTGRRDHVTLLNVRGVKFYGCDFNNKITDEPYSGNGIFALNSGYIISGACDNPGDEQPCQTYNNTKFAGFYRAVESANSSNTLNGIYIRNTDFENNGYGIYFSAVNNAVVVGNTFSLGVYDDCNYDAGNGIYLDNCKQFAIEDNVFSIPSSA